MRAGKLDREISIEAPAGTTVNNAGTPTETWEPFATVRAEKIEGSTTEFLRGYGETDQTAMLFRTRFFDGLTTAHRVAFEGQYLNIREITEIGRRRGLELRCERVRS